MDVTKLKLSSAIREALDGAGDEVRDPAPSPLGDSPVRDVDPVRVPAERGEPLDVEADRAADVEARLRPTGPLGVVRIAAHGRHEPGVDRGLDLTVVLVVALRAADEVRLVEGVCELLRGH